MLGFLGRVCSAFNSSVMEDREVKDDLPMTPMNQMNKVEFNTAYKVWIPEAENIDKSEGLKMKTRGEYEQGYPQGLVVHYTAGWALKRGHWWKPFPLYTRPDEKLRSLARRFAVNTAKLGTKNGHNYLVMDVFGKVYQSRPLSKHGYHAGKSYWPSVGHSVSSKFAGIEILSPGILTEKDGKFFTWYKQEIPAEYVREIPSQDENRAKGYYCAFSAEQEKSLKNLAIWMHKNSPFVDGKPSLDKIFVYDNVVGHDEVSPGRKTDPGGCLSVNMKDFRRMLFKEKIYGDKA